MIFSPFILLLLRLVCSTHIFAMEFRIHSMSAVAVLVSTVEVPNIYEPVYTHSLTHNLYSEAYGKKFASNAIKM